MKHDHYKYAALLTLFSIICIFFVAKIPDNHSAPPPILGEIKAFELTNQDNQAFNSASLKGKVWIANFFFTSCPNTCPLMIRNIKALQKRFKLGYFNIVSISVDPKTDTPEHLKAFASKADLNLQYWTLLTGEQEKIKEIMRQSFLIGAMEDLNLHSDRIILIDQQMQIRGFYSAQSGEDQQKLAMDLKSLM